MSSIQAIAITKSFSVRHSKAGFRGAIRSLFAAKNSIVTAVDNISFDIQKGEIVGFLGPNGAGKSTTLKILTGVLHPNKGKVFINGICPHTERLKAVRRIGVTFGHRSQLFWDLRLEESYELLRRIYRIPDRIYKGNLAWLGSAMEFNDLLNVPVRQLSLGQRMRAEIAAALLHSPDILFLDEPTIGLDIQAKDAVRKIIKQVNSEYNTTVLLTTHDVGDVRELCRRLIVIDKGRIVQDGEISLLLRRLAPYSVLMIEFSSDHPSIFHASATVLKREGRRLWLQFDGNIISNGKLISELCSKYPIHDLSIREPDISDLIRKCYTQNESFSEKDQKN